MSVPPRSRLATLADAQALVRLVNSAYRGETSRRGWTTEADLLGGQRTDVEALHEFIGFAKSQGSPTNEGTSTSERAMLLLDDAAGQPLACVQLERRDANSAYLGMLTVRPDVQAAGLGKELLAAAESYVVRTWGSSRMLMTVIAQRDTLIAWYERRGYRKTGETAAFPYGNPRFGEPLREDLHFVVLAKTLAAPLASPLVIAHRGASGHRPEHTLEAYRLAIGMGADFIEPDLVATRDGHLVARHEPEISATTDVAARAEFAARKRRLRIDGVEYDGWFTTDFTLAELKTLRAIEPRADRSKTFDGQYPIPTLEEIVELAQRESARLGRTIGIYPETKHPHWHCTQGLALEPRLLTVLENVGWTERHSPVYIQSFEAGNLRWLRERTAVRLVQLLGGDGLTADGKVIPAKPWTNDGSCERYPVGELPEDFDDPRSFAQIAEYAEAIGPWKRFLVGERKGDDGSARASMPTRFVELAHAAGLAVHPWTFRNEAVHLLADYAGDPLKEYRAYATLGVDAVFTDYPDTALQAFERAEAQPRD